MIKNLRASIENKIIGIVDVDSHNFPNIPLMKIAAYFKSKGRIVEWYEPGKTYDQVYVSKIFTESKDVHIRNARIVLKGGSGYDLINKLPDCIENMFPDYSLYPELTKETAYGMLTRGCPRCNHTFCITPEKDGKRTRKVANLDQFWSGQKNIILTDQNLLACKDRIPLLNQLADSGANVEFDGGLDIRFLNDEIICCLKKIKVKSYHFAWDDPREDLYDKFKLFANSNIKNPNAVGVYVLTNFWSSHKEDLMRIKKLRKLGFMPFVMIYDKQKFVDSRGRWHKGIENKYTVEQLRHFKTCQHMQRWCGNRAILKSCKTLNDYEPYAKWKANGKPVPGI